MIEQTVMEIGDHQIRAVCVNPAVCGRHFNGLAADGGGDDCGIGVRHHLPMTKYYTREGLQMKQRQLAAQEQKVRGIGKEAGDEAGLNCDWHDNFGYEDAKRRLEMESTFLAQLREDLNGVQIINVDDQCDKVGIGVTVVTSMNGDERTITIGAYGESDPANGLIAYTSPLGRALLGMRPGDTKRGQIGGKSVELEILDILPPAHRYRDLISKFLIRETTSPELTKSGQQQS